MAKLNPPILEGKIPAFASRIIQTEQGETISKHIEVEIPFVMNRSVSYDDIFGMIVKFKTVGGIVIGNPIKVVHKIHHGDPIPVDPDDPYIDIDKNIIYIQNTPPDIDKRLNVGQYYKIQIAYIDYNELDGDSEGDIGYYSSVGVAKYTVEPEVTCEKIANYELLFRGYYDPSDYEKTEKLYSSRFKLQTGYTHNDGDKIRFYPYPNVDGDTHGSVVENTEEKVHMNPETNYEDYEIRRELDWDFDIPTSSDAKPNIRAYRVTFITTSVNDYQKSGDVYFYKPTLVDFPTPGPGETFVLAVSNEYENGYITINLTNGTLPNTYNYILWRYDTDEQWIRIKNDFVDSYQDFSIEQGKTYKYALQGIPVNGVSPATEKLESEEITGQFEDMFLSDSKRQLRIQFNPKVNGYKRTILESKIDTIGGKYPIIFRNGNVDYREIGLGGLISYLMDKDNMFKVFADSPGEAIRQDTASTTNDPPHNPTSLSDNNRHKERVFREAVLEWLTNGESKYFRSPTEGNHIVRVMNVSLSPIDTVGRMIYNFTATSYEIADNTIENLIKYSLVDWEV